MRATLFTKEELEELRRFDAMVDAEPMTHEDYAQLAFIEELLFPGRKHQQKKKQVEQNERRKQWRREHPDEARARDRAAYQRKKAKKLAEANMTPEELEAKRQAEAEEKATRHEETVKRQRERYAAQYAERKESEVERKRKWYQENKDRIKAQQRDYRLRVGLILYAEEKEARKAAKRRRKNQSSPAAAVA